MNFREPPPPSKLVGQRALNSDWGRWFSIPSIHEFELNFESCRPPVNGLDKEPFGLMGGGNSLQHLTTQLPDILQAIRPCRESKTGWTRRADRLGGNQNSITLNEHGPALKVFWSRRWRDGRRVGEHARLPKRARVVMERWTKKTEPEGAGPGAIRSAPFGSKVGQPEHQLNQR